MIRVIRRLLGIRPTGPVWSPAQHPTVTDPSPQDLAALQMACRGWAVMWSRWRRAYTAFALLASEPLIVDAPDPELLLQRCRAIEAASSFGREFAQLDAALALRIADRRYRASR